MNNNRVELCCHTKMSKLQGINDAKEYIEEAIKRGYKSIAITDTDSTQAFFEAYENIGQLDYSMFSNIAIDKYSRILKDNIQSIDKENISSSGYIVNTLEATMWLFLNSNDYNETVLKAVNLGEDTDTVAACTGGLLGLYYGIENIKDKWKQELKKYDYIIELCDKFDKIQCTTNDKTLHDQLY